MNDLHDGNQLEAFTYCIKCATCLQSDRGKTTGLCESCVATTTEGICENCGATFTKIWTAERHCLKCDQEMNVGTMAALNALYEQTLAGDPEWERPEDGQDY